MDHNILFSKEELENLIKDLQDIQLKARCIELHLHSRILTPIPIQVKIDRAETMLKNKEITTPSEYFDVLNND